MTASITRSLAPGKAIVADFNKQFEGHGPKAKLVEFSESGRPAARPVCERSAGNSAYCDIFHSDAIWTAEFAQQKWLYDMTAYIDPRRSEFIASTMDTPSSRTGTGRAVRDERRLLVDRTDQVDKGARSILLDRLVARSSWRRRPKGSRRSRLALPISGVVPPAPGRPR